MTDEQNNEPLTGVLQKSGFSAELNICASNSASSQSPKSLAEILPRHLITKEPTEKWQKQ